ncbi:hypothetical protein VCHENC02_2214B, partial [Vibrio harveyi]
VPLGSIY